MNSIRKISILFLSVLFLSACNKSESIYVAKYKDDKEAALSYTFDDGLQEHYSLVLPQLEQHGFKGTFWICGSWVNETDSIDSVFLNWSQIKEMSERGHEMSNHSWSHPCLTALSDDSIRLEIQKNDSVMYSKLGIKSKTFAYPYSCINENVIKIASGNRVGTRTQLFGIGGDASKNTSENLNKKVQELLKNKEWGVAMIHGITSGYDYFTTPEILWDHFAQVKKMEDKIWVDTFEKIASYETERDNIELDIQKHDNTYTIVPKLTLDKDLFTEPLTMVVKEKGIKSISIKQGGQNLFFKETNNKVIFEFDPFGGTIEINFHK